MSDISLKINEKKKQEDKSLSPKGLNMLLNIDSYSQRQYV